MELLLILYHGTSVRPLLTLANDDGLTPADAALAAPGKSRTPFVLSSHFTHHVRYKVVHA